jgi:hypothetical protein
VPQTEEEPKTPTELKKGVLERLESISRIVSAVAIPTVIGIGTWVIQVTLSSQSVSKDYVSLAISILEKDSKSGSEDGLKSWAVDLLNKTSPVPLDPDTAQKLRSGELIFNGPLSDVDRIRNFETIPESAAKMVLGQKGINIQEGTSAKETLAEEVLKKAKLPRFQPPGQAALSAWESITYYRINASENPARTRILAAACDDFLPTI